MAKDIRGALKAKFRVSNADSKLYVMEQFCDYKMVDERPIVEQAHKIHSLAQELEQIKCVTEQVYYQRHYCRDSSLVEEF
jgi:predicted GNAT family N-acyltransferase